MFTNDGRVVLSRRTWGVGWGTEDNVATGLGGLYNVTPVMTVDMQNHNVWLVWENIDHVVYREKNINGTWGPTVDWIDESTDTFSRNNGSGNPLNHGAVVGSADRVYDNRIMIYYQTKTNGSAPPYKIKFAYTWTPLYLHLTPGWNLISFPVENATLHNIFWNLRYNTDYSAWYWTPPGGPYQQPTEYQLLQDNLAYWIWVAVDENVRVEGLQPVSHTITLIGQGWNMVSFPVVTENTTPDNVFAPLTYYDNYYIYYWATPGPYVTLGPHEVFKENVGYWVWIDQDKTVSVP
jgi:hypothetical protein